MQTEQLMCWSGMTDTEHTAISGSNEVVVLYVITHKNTNFSILSVNRVIFD